MNAIQINKFILQETGVYNPLYQRPYQTHLDGSSLDAIQSRISETGTSNVTPSLLSGISTTVVTPQAIPGSKIIIPNGWDERRIRFLMEVQVTTPTGAVFLYYLQGYTSHLGVGSNGSIDPAMMFYINSWIRVSRFVGPNMVTSDIVTESAHVVNGNIEYEYRSMDSYTLRPCDVFTGMQYNYLNNSYSYYDDSATELIDSRTLLKDSVRSNRANNIPSAYVANVINSHINATQLNEYGQNEIDVTDRSRQLSHESNLNENIFIRAIANIQGNTDGTSFTFETLEVLDRNVTNITNFISVSSTQMKQLSSPGETAYWDEASREVVAATILTNAIPAIMMELMITKIQFRTTNSGTGGQVETIVISGNTLSNMNTASTYEKFKTRLITDILQDITYNNQDIVMLDMSADLFGDTTLTISLSGQSPITFTTPSFADGIVTPVLTNDLKGFHNLVTDFEAITSGVSDAIDLSTPTI